MYYEAFLNPFLDKNTPKVQKVITVFNLNDLRASAAKMGFFDHLDELRERLMKCLYVFAAGFLASYFWITEPVMNFLKRPLFQALPPDQQKLYFTSLFENFLTHLKISGYASLFLLAPYFFYQIWAFIAPGLYPRERKYVVPFVVALTAFFLAGAAFAYTVLFPVGFKFFVEYGGPTDMPLLTIDSYYSTCIKLMFLFGVAFELPVLIVFLGFLGVVSSEILKRSRRGAIIGITAVAALFAPPDAISMLLLMIPLILFYEGSIWVVARIERAKSAGQATQAGEPQAATASGSGSGSGVVPSDDPIPEEYDPFRGESK